LEQQVRTVFSLFKASGKTNFASVLTSIMSKREGFQELGDRANHIGQGGKSIQQYEILPLKYPLPSGEAMLISDLRGFHHMNQMVGNEYGDLLEKCYVGKIPREFLNERNVFGTRIKSSSVVNDFHQIIFFVLRADKLESFDSTMSMINTIRRSQIPLILICTHMDKLSKESAEDFKTKINNEFEIVSRVYYFGFGDLKNFDSIQMFETQIYELLANVFLLMNNCEYSGIGVVNETKLALEDSLAIITKKIPSISMESAVTCLSLFTIFFWIVVMFFLK
jgi:hypothetical protein